MKQHQADRTPGHQGLEQFLVRSRRRFLYTAFLWNCLWAVLANEALRWGTVGLNVAFSLDLSIFTVGLYVFAVLMIRSVARGRRRAALARRMDRGLALKDRLASYVDFRGRDDVPEPFRRAQAAEADEFLRERQPAEAFRVGPFLRVAPALFLAMLAFDYLNPFMPGHLVFRTISKIPQAQRADSQAVSMEENDPEASGIRETIVPADDEDLPDTDTVDHQLDISDMQGEEAAERDRREGQAAESVSERTRLAGRPMTNAEQGGGGVGNRWEEEPVRLHSETIGRALTPVSAKAGITLEEAGEKVAPPDVVLKGRVAFDLAPRGTEEAFAGNGEGGREEALRVVVDFDGIPTGYRVYVRRYFKGLGAETE